MEYWDGILLVISGMALGAGAVFVWKSSVGGGRGRWLGSWGGEGRGGNGERDSRLWAGVRESSQLLVAETDKRGLIQFANDRLCEARGMTDSEITGTSLPYLVHVEERNALSNLLRDVAEGSSPGGGVVARLLTFGETAPRVLWSAVPVRDARGEVRGVAGIGVDLTGEVPVRELSGGLVTELAEARERGMRLAEENRSLQLELERVREPAGRQTAERDGNGRGGVFVELEDGSPPLAELERRYIERILERTGGRVSGDRGAAGILGLHPNTLRSRMKKLGIGRR